MLAKALRISLFALGILVPAAVFAADAKEEVQKLQETWTATSVIMDGKEVEVTGMKMTVSGDTVTLKRGDTVVMAGTVKLDPSKTPKEIDLTYTDGPNKGKTSFGIYELDGDTMKSCAAIKPDSPRPTEFASAPGSGLRLSVYKKSK